MSDFFFQVCNRGECRNPMLLKLTNQSVSICGELNPAFAPIINRVTRDETFAF